VPVDTRQAVSALIVAKVLMRVSASRECQWNATTKQ
jgi:hypothetical protein